MLPQKKFTIGVPAETRKKSINGSSYDENTYRKHFCADDHAELKLDRPFLFTIFTQRGQPLFTGVVRYPDTH